MKKRFLMILLSIFIILILTSCFSSEEDRMRRKIEKAFEEFVGYETETEINITMGDSKSYYETKESYSIYEDYKIEILEPTDSKGITIEYIGEDIVINHTSIRQSLTMKNLKTFDKGYLIGEFIPNLNSIISIKEEVIDNKELYVLQYIVQNQNKYNKEQILYLNKKDFTPYMLNILDEDKIPRVTVKYKKFKYMKN